MVRTAPNVKFRPARPARYDTNGLEGPRETQLFHLSSKYEWTVRSGKSSMNSLYG